MYNSKEKINNVMEMLKKSPLNFTSQRKALIEIIFADGNTHFTAEDIHKKAKEKKINISLATIYNNLNIFKNFNMLNKVITNSEKMYFDTNLKDHHHFYCAETGELTDINSSKVVITKLPEIPQGKTINSVNVVINLNNKITQNNSKFLLTLIH